MCGRMCGRVLRKIHVSASVAVSVLVSVAATRAPNRHNAIQRAAHDKQITSTAIAITITATTGNILRASPALGDRRKDEVAGVLRGEESSGTHVGGVGGAPRRVVMV